jgi:3-oxoacyl-[acyl-carrier protein] reductase
MGILDGKVSLVSASSSGIGKAVAKVLASEGSKVHMFSSNRHKIADAAREIAGATGAVVNYSVGNMTVPSDVKRVMDEALKNTGNIDNLVVNYGDPKVAPFMEITDEDWDSSINMFLKGTIAMVRIVIPYMQAHGGRVVFITSMTTKSPLENFSISASLRSAVVSLSKVLSMEFASKGITFNSISQGYFMTPRLESIAERNSAKQGISKEEALQQIRDTIPSRRFGDPEEIGHLVSFLCSKEASYINGANIQIDGGVIRFPF